MQTWLSPHDTHSDQCGRYIRLSPTAFLIGLIKNHRISAIDVKMFANLYQVGTMKNILKICSVGVVLLLAGCGGGGTSADNSTVTVDSIAPTVSGVTAGAPASGAVALTATATDNVLVTAYCFKDSTTTPSSSDACFQPANTKTVQLAVPNATYYVWAKDASGNISAPSSARGPCNASGYTASDASTKPTVCMATSLGQFVVELELTAAPITTTNFLKYVNDGFYSSTVFHRVLSNFMVQGGGLINTSGSLTQKSTPYAAITLETPAQTGISNVKGVIAMARTSVLNSATSQFFINVVNNTGLDTSGGGYAAFGRVINGMDTTIEAIRTVSVVSNGSETSLPTTPPVILWAYQLK